METKTMETKKFKGWGVLVAAFILSFIHTAIMSNCFSPVSYTHLDHGV